VPLDRLEAMESTRDSFLARAGLSNPSVKDVINTIKAIPHGRPRERSAHGVVQDWRGTCSTKLLLLREICPDLPMRLYNRVFLLTPETARERLGDDVAQVIPPRGTIDVHTFAKIHHDKRWVLIDLTFPGELWDGHHDMELPWPEGQDFEAGDDPIASKEALVQQHGDPETRTRLIEAIS
jgi:hypothetical protein